MNKTLADIKAKGFNYIKLELEANTGVDGESREDCDYCDCGEVECNYCSGEGQNECQFCDGSGDIDVEHENEDGTTNWQYETCEECNGSGYEECGECYGSGRVTCDECGGDYEGYQSGGFQELEDQIYASLPKHLSESIVFSRIYYDGSVNTEWTFTIPIEKALSLPKFIKAFKDSACNLGGSDSFNQRNAGLHISISKTANPDESRLDPECNENFKKNLKKLLFGLCVLSSPNDRTRDFQYRRPNIEDGGKYHFVYTHDSRFYEYRLFDPIFDTPNHIVKYLEVIAKTLKFYTPNKKVTAKVKQLQFNETMADRRTFVEIFESPEAKARAIKEVETLLGKALASSHLKRAKLVA